MIRMKNKRRPLAHMEFLIKKLCIDVVYYDRPHDPISLQKKNNKLF